MVEFIPFRAFQYNLRKISKLEDVIAPPYDVIKPAQERELKKHVNNITHVDLPISYKNAAKLLNNWIKEKILIQPEKKAFYIYEIKFHKNDTPSKIQGLVGLIKPVDFSEKKILPHEMTFPKCMDDRTKLLENTNANFGPIYLIYQGNSKLSTILADHSNSNPILSVTDRDGFIHTIRKIDDPGKINDITSEFKSIKLIIADGHHRYKTGLLYSKQKNGLKYVMSFLVDIQNPGLLIFPTHRMIKSFKNTPVDKFLKKIEENFDIQEFKDDKELIHDIESCQRFHVFGFIHGPTKSFYKFTLKASVDPTKLIKKSHSDEWKKLDVSILHELILTDELNSNGNITYEKNVENGINSIKDNEHEGIIILKPTELESIQKITEFGEIMPHKSTYFHPKPLSGLLIFKK